MRRSSVTSSRLLPEVHVGGRRVVVVEDDDDLREIVVQVLADLGFESEGVGDGREALVLLRRGAAALPMAILLDLEMPVMDGWEFRREQLRDPRLAGVPVVVTSSADARDIHADVLLPKPYEIADLCRVLAAIALRRAAA
jgi:CheY-like chemotaxis protein